MTYRVTLIARCCQLRPSVFVHVGKTDHYPTGVGAVLSALIPCDPLGLDFNPMKIDLTNRGNDPALSKWQGVSLPRPGAHMYFLTPNIDLPGTGLLIPKGLANMLPYFKALAPGGTGATFGVGLGC